ncbi:MAG TPA: hypothetical protein VJ123_08685 [Anaerolineales bacterium]|nr:hypothetical protein [Anaerolineales bacterium]
MTPVDYLVLRTLRRMLPRGFVRWLVRHRIGIKPGLETREPFQAAERYQEALAADGRTLRDACVLVYGYGGSYGIAVELLLRGARHVVLSDPYATPDHRADQALAARAGRYLRVHGSRVEANTEFITLFNCDIGEARDEPWRPVDLVLSSSVYEHLRRPEEQTEALAQLTAPTGFHVHFVDLRDHYFRRPFEMLCYSEGAWRRFFNPPSNLNRLRLGDYEMVFLKHFRQVRCEVIERDPAAFGRTRPRIRPEFLTGDEDRDCVTQIAVHAWEPIRR